MTAMKGTTIWKDPPPAHISSERTSAVVSTACYHNLYIYNVNRLDPEPTTTRPRRFHEWPLGKTITTWIELLLTHFCSILFSWICWRDLKKIAGDAATRSQDPWSGHIKLNYENDRKPTLFLLCVCGYAKYHIHVSMRYLTNFSNDTHGSNFANGECNHPRDGKSCQRIPVAKLAYYTHGLSQIPSQKRPTHFLVGCLLLCS